MSLQVWLPLAGNLDNFGLSNVAVTNNGATIDNNGKIGKCYSFNNNTSYISLTSTSIDNCFKGGNNPFSIACWILHTDASRAIIFGDYSLTGAININLELSGGHALRFYWAGSPDIYFTTVLTANIWQHVVVTYDGTKLRYYLNGELKDTQTHTLAEKSKINGEWRLGRDARTGTTTLNGKLNDFRIYNHCLSAKEVKEISKALVLHYPMNNPYIEKTTNVAVYTGAGGWNNSGNSVRSNNDTTYANIPISNKPVYSILQTAAGNSALTFSSISGMAGKTVAVSTYVYLSGPTSGNTIYLRSTVNDNKAGNEICYLTYNGSNNPTTWPQNQWIRITGVGNVVTNETSVYICTYTNNLNEKRAFNGWQIEINDHVTPYTASSRNEDIEYDCGIANIYDGTVPSSVIIERDAPRGTYAYRLASNTYIAANIDPKFLTTCSISFWAKINTVAANGWIPISNTVDGTHYCCASSNGTGSFFEDNGNKDALFANRKYYVDGVQQSNPNNAIGQWHHYVITNLNLSDWPDFSLNGYPASSWRSDVSYTDLRVYNTILSAEDIAELYHSAVIVDNTGKSYAYEFFEAQ